MPASARHGWLVAAILAGVAPPALAQAPKPGPAMGVLICKDFKDAQRQAEKSRIHAELPSPAADATPYIQNGCEYHDDGYHAIDEITSIPPFMAWIAVFSPDPSAPKIRREISGEWHEIGYKIERRRVRYYDGKIRSHGDFYGYYIEAPDEGSLVGGYLQERRRSR